MDGNKIRLTHSTVVISSLLCVLFLASPASAFTFYVKSEPQSLDPIKTISGESNYIHSTLFRGLTRYTDEGLLVFDQAERCRYIIDTELRCTLKKNLKYSDGTPILPQDFISAFERIKSSTTGSYVTPLLSNVKAMKVRGDKEIQFFFKEPDFEFMEKLAHPLLIPYKNEKVFNGPYQINKKDKGKLWQLVPNNYYLGGFEHRPSVYILFVPDDFTAVNLFEKGRIDFLWRLPSSEIPRFKGKPEFLQIPQSRFDYIGFNQRPGSPLADISLRKKLIESVDFEEFKKVFFALGRPGCSGLSDRFLTEEATHCQEFRPGKPGQDIEPVYTKRELEFKFSLLGGDDIQRQATWLQDQWRNNAGIKVRLKSIEQKGFVASLKTHPPDIFRKGIGLSRASCLAGLEYFKSDHPENFTGFSDPKFDAMIKPLSNRKLSRNEENIICGAAFNYLFNEKLVGIPLGRIHFTMLVNPKIKNIHINELNQLDLADLEESK